MGQEIQAGARPAIPASAATNAGRSSPSARVPGGAGRFSSGLRLSFLSPSARYSASPVEKTIRGDETAMAKGRPAPKSRTCASAAAETSEIESAAE